MAAVEVAGVVINVNLLVPLSESMEAAALSTSELKSADSAILSIEYGLVPGVIKSCFILYRRLSILFVAIVDSDALVEHNDDVDEEISLHLLSESTSTSRGEAMHASAFASSL